MVNKYLTYSYENHKPISIIYMKGMEISQRKIQVLKISKDYIKAFDIDKGQIRTFRIVNILSAIDSIYSNNYYKKDNSIRI